MMFALCPLPLLLPTAPGAPRRGLWAVGTTLDPPAKSSALLHISFPSGTWGPVLAACLPGLSCEISPETASIYQSPLPWGHSRGAVRALAWRGKAPEQPGLPRVLVNASPRALLARGTRSGLQDTSQSRHTLPSPRPSPCPGPPTPLGCWAPPGRAEACSVTSPWGAAGRLGEGRRRFAGAEAH